MRYYVRNNRTHCHVISDLISLQTLETMLSLVAQKIFLWLSKLKLKIGKLHLTPDLLENNYSKASGCKQSQVFNKKFNHQLKF